MNKIIPLLCLLLLCGCHRHKSDPRPVLTVSIEPLRFVVESIAGDSFAVRTLMPQGASPETYEPTPRQMVELDGSVLLFRNGTLGFERTKLAQMAQATPGVRMVDVAEGIEEIAEGAQGHAHDGETSADPHIWMSPDNLSLMAENVCRALCAADSLHAPAYEQRLRNFKARMDEIDGQLRQRLTPLRQRTFVIYHPALGYFARQYGLQQTAIEHDGKEPSAARLQQLIKSCQASHVRTVLISKEHTGRAAQRVAESLGTKPVEINPLDYDVPQQLLRIAEVLESHDTN